MQYSWGEWDLLTNREIRVLRVCHTRLTNLKLPAKAMSTPEVETTK